MGRYRAPEPQFPDLDQWERCESVTQLKGLGGGKFEQESERGRAGGRRDASGSFMQECPVGLREVQDRGSS